MKKIVLQLPYNRENSIEVIKGNFVISKVDETNVNSVERFLINYANGESVALGSAFVVLLPNNGSDQILGLICFEENNVRTKFQFPIKDPRNNHHTELTYFIVDEKLMDKKLLLDVLMRIIPLITTTECIDEVIWFDYRGELYSRYIDSVYKRNSQFTYYFQNESEYFADKLVSIYEGDIERETTLLGIGD